jgi:hypothetical protein
MGHTVQGSFNGLAMFDGPMDDFNTRLRCHFAVVA